MKQNLYQLENMTILPRDFYARPTIVVAPELLGKLLIHSVGGEKKIARIVEVEAYLGPEDLACHAAKGRTKRTEVMFGPPGYAYVYLIYGMYFCLNVVTEQAGHASAVLLRAVEPVRNITLRTQGPGLLCKALDIDKRLNGHDLLSPNFHLASDGTCVAKNQIVKKKRIGVDYSGHWANRLLRFYLKNNVYVSKK